MSPAMAASVATMIVVTVFHRIFQIVNGHFHAEPIATNVRHMVKRVIGSNLTAQMREVVFDSEVVVYHVFIRSSALNRVMQVTCTRCQTVSVVRDVRHSSDVMNQVMKVRSRLV